MFSSSTALTVSHKFSHFMFLSSSSNSKYFLISIGTSWLMDHLKVCHFIFKHLEFSPMYLLLISKLLSACHRLFSVCSQHLKMCGSFRPSISAALVNVPHAPEGWVLQGIYQMQGSGHADRVKLAYCVCQITNISTDFCPLPWYDFPHLFRFTYLHLCV